MLYSVTRLSWVGEHEISPLIFFASFGKLTPTLTFLDPFSAAAAGAGIPGIIVSK